MPPDASPKLPAAPRWTVVPAEVCRPEALPWVLLPFQWLSLCSFALFHWLRLPARAAVVVRCAALALARPAIVPLVFGLVDCLVLAATVKLLGGARDRRAASPLARVYEGTRRSGAVWTLR